MGSLNHSKLHNIGLLSTGVCDRGGIQSFMLRIIELMGEMVIQCQSAGVFCLSLNDGTEELRKHPSMPSNVKVWGGNGSKLKLITHALTFKSSINTLIVGHVHLAPLALTMRVLGKINNYHVILHGIEAWKRVSLLERFALLSAKSIIATTHYTVEECAKYNFIPTERFKVIPLCADERNVLPTLHFRLNGKFKILCVSRQDVTEHHKGLEQIFKALVLLKESHPSIHLNLIGNGNYQSNLKAVVNKLDITEYVTFWGSLSNEDLVAAYLDCDMFAMPSKKEGFGIVFLEAMRFNKPCVGGDHGGTPDVIDQEKSGFLVDYENIHELAGCIKTLVENESLRIQMGQYGGQLVKTKFSKQAFQSAYQEIILGE